MAGMDAPARYHLLLALGGVPAMHGWWESEVVARRQFRDWVGERGRAGTRIVLVDEEDGVELAVWPE